MKTFEFEGEFYNDDRLFVLHIAKCSIKEDSESITTRVYHEEAPENHLWCVIMYRNVPRYRPLKVFHFDNETEAQIFLRDTEPVVPLISLQGESPPENQVLSYKEYLDWKEANNLKDYDYRKMFWGFMGSNPGETICIPK